MSFLTARQHMLARYGRSMTLNRLTGSTSTGGITTRSLPLQGFLTAYAPEQLTGDVKQGDAQVSILDEEIAAAGWDRPRARDQFLIDGRTWAVMGSTPVYDGDTCLGHKVWVRGGAG